MSAGPAAVPSGWVLIEAQVGRGSCLASVRLKVRRRSALRAVEDLSLPVMAQGRIRELVLLPDDVAELSWQHSGGNPVRQYPLTVRPVGMLERTVRMAYRALRMYGWLTPEERSRFGLSLWGVASHLPEAYRIATAARMHYRSMPYGEWIDRFDTIGDDDLRTMRAQVGRFAPPPHFHVLVSVSGRREGAVRATLSSLREQVYGQYSCSVIDLDEVSTSDPGLANQPGGVHVVSRTLLQEWLSGFNASLAGKEPLVLLLRAGDMLPVHALYWLPASPLRGRMRSFCTRTTTRWTRRDGEASHVSNLTGRSRTCARRTMWAPPQCCVAALSQRRVA
jgi:hypothetical protein